MCLHSFNCASILFLRFWITFTIIFTKYSEFFQIDCLFLLHLLDLVGFYHVSSFAEWFSVVSFCLICWVWGLLSIVCKIVVPLISGVFPLWVELLQCLVTFSWLWGIVAVFWWMELDLVSLKGSAMSSGVFGVSVGLIWLYTAYLLMGRAVFLFFWRFDVRHLAWSLLVFVKGLVLMLRWRTLGDLKLINFPWNWEFFGGPKSWIWVSHLGDSGPIPYCSTNIPQVTQHRRQNPQKMVIVTLNRQEYPKTLTKRKEESKRGKKE